MMFSQLKSLRAFFGNTSGSLSILGALSMIVLLAFVGLSIDIGSWYSEKRSMQAAADAAAIAAALEIGRGATVTDAVARAKSIATANGYTTGGHVTVDVRTPPTSGPHNGDADYVEAVVRLTTTGLFSKLVTSNGPDIGARAVATIVPVETCIFVLDSSAHAAFKASGSAQINLDCGVLVNSSDAHAIETTGSACINAPTLAAVGGSNGACQNPIPKSGAEAALDPLSYLTPPATGGCDFVANVVVGSSDIRIFDPAVDDTDNDGYVTFCDGLNVDASANVTFLDGIYIMDGKGFHINGSATVTGAGVTFYFPPTVDSTFLGIAGTAVVDLVAPTTGPYKGIVFYLDRSASSSVVATVTGDSTLDVTGTIYLPVGKLRFSGSSNNVGTGVWTVLVVNQVEFVENTTISFSGVPASDTPTVLNQASLSE